MLVRELAPLDASLADEVAAEESLAATHELHPSAIAEQEAADGGVGASMRAVAPAVQSFASGRRR